MPLSIDEGVRSVRDVAQIVRYRAAEIICVKPARVGGLANARTIIVRAQEAGFGRTSGDSSSRPTDATSIARWPTAASTNRVTLAPSTS